MHKSQKFLLKANPEISALEIFQLYGLLIPFSYKLETWLYIFKYGSIIIHAGSFATASCMHCKYQVDAEEIKEDIFNQVNTIVVYILNNILHMKEWLLMSCAQCTNCNIATLLDKGNIKYMEHNYLWF